LINQYEDRGSRLEISHQLSRADSNSSFIHQPEAFSLQKSYHPKTEFSLSQPESNQSDAEGDGYDLIRQNKKYHPWPEEINLPIKNAGLLVLEGRGTGAESNSSVKSDDDEIFSLLGSVSSKSSDETFYHTGIEAIVEIFISDVDLLSLYQDAIKTIERERLIRNQRRLLKRYYLSLQSQARAPLEFEVTKILRNRRTRISIAQKVLMRLSSPKNYIQSSSCQMSREQRLERYFQRFKLSSNDDEKEIVMRPATPPDELTKGNLPPGNDDGHLSEETESSCDNKSDDNKPEKGSYSVEDAKKFLIGGSPFEQYKLSLRRFVHPTLTAAPSQDSSQETHAAANSGFLYRNDKLLTQSKRLAVIELAEEVVARAILLLLWIVVPLNAVFVRRGYYMENSEKLLGFCVRDICKNWLGISSLAPQVVRIEWICVL
jgi:hypothetical protein